MLFDERAGATREAPEQPADASHAQRLVAHIQDRYETGIRDRNRAFQSVAKCLPNSSQIQSAQVRWTMVHLSKLVQLFRVLAGSRVAILRPAAALKAVSKASKPHADTLPGGQLQELQDAFAAVAHGADKILGDFSFL